MSEETFTTFFPLQKVVEQPDGTCLVYSRGTQEVRDAVGEMFDYETSVPEIRAWSDDVFKTSGGKSYGNIRAMHGKQAAGKLSEPIGYIDAEKAIDLVVKVIDPVDVKKCKEGVYTGMSLGGKYKNRWFDPVVGLYRYTAKPEEWSLVDRPAVPTATFQLVKADGSEELCKFAGVIETTVSEDEPPSELADMEVNGEPDTPTELMVAPLAETATSEMPLSADGVPLPPNPLQIGITEVALPASDVPDMGKLSDVVNQITSRLDRFVDAVEKAAEIKKASDDEKAAQEAKLKTLGAKVGIARRDGEPLTQPSGYPSDPNDYGDPANWSWPCDSKGRCTSAIAYFNGGKGKDKYSDREWNVLGRRIAQRAGTAFGAKYQYSPKDKKVQGVEKTMTTPLTKDALGSVVADLRSAAQSAMDNISDPAAVMAALHQILAGIDVATDTDSAVHSEATTAGSTLEAAAGSTTSTPTTPTTTGTTTATPTDSSSSSEEMKTMMTKFDQLADSQKQLQDTFTKFLEALKPAERPVQKTVTLGDLNALVQEPDANATTLEKAIVSAALQAPDGVPTDAVLEVMKAAGGDVQTAQDKAMELVRRSLSKRGITAQERVRVIG